MAHAASSARRPGNQLADLPDFDSYPFSRRLVWVSPSQRGVLARWDDGLEAKYHVLWLRENAPDADAMHPVTREQALQLVDIPEDLDVKSAEIDDAGNLAVSWSTGSQSLFHPGWLRAYTAGSVDLGKLPDRQLWGAEFELRLPRLDGPKILNDEAELGRWMEALHVYGVAILEGLPAAEEVIETLPARIGPIRASNFGKVFDVRSREDADSNAYTSMALPLHTDLATREYKPGLQFLHCLENSAAGGDGILADGFFIAKKLSKDVPELFHALTTIPVTFYNKARDTDYRWSTPMIQRGHDGECKEVRWSPWLRAPVALPFEQTDLLYRALRSAFATAESPRSAIRLRLKPGDLLGFDNRRVLHGRTAFEPASGNRWLRGCYVEREDLESRLRIAARRKRSLAPACNKSGAYFRPL